MPLDRPQRTQERHRDLSGGMGSGEPKSPSVTLTSLLRPTGHPAYSERHGATDVGLLGRADITGPDLVAMSHLPASLAGLTCLYGIDAISQKLPSTDSALSDPPGRSTVSALGGQAGRFFIPQNVEFAPHRTCWAMICRGQGRSLARLRWSIKSLRVRESGRGRIRGGDPTSTARQDALTS
jgi:hypothetical protein